MTSLNINFKEEIADWERGRVEYFVVLQNSVASSVHITLVTQQYAPWRVSQSSLLWTNFILDYIGPILMEDIS